MATNQEVLEKVQKLVRLATNDAEGTGEEARNAAMQATRLMKEHELVLIPRSEIERVERTIGELREASDKAKGTETQKMMMGALAGFFFAKKF